MKDGRAAKKRQEETKRQSGSLEVTPDHTASLQLGKATL
jgi:hypothetical protein